MSTQPNPIGIREAGLRLERYNGKRRECEYQKGRKKNETSGADGSNIRGGTSKSALHPRYHNRVKSEVLLYVKRQKNMTYSVPKGARFGCGRRNVGRVWTRFRWPVCSPEGKKRARWKLAIVVFKRLAII